MALTPAGVAELTRRGHEVLVQSGAGEGSSIPDSEFKAAGAQLADTAEQVWADAELLLKVKEPVPAEYDLLRRNQILFTFLHLAASRACTEALLSSGTTSIAYETVQTADGTLPLLAPMSEVAGRLSAQVGAYHLMRTHGGRGVLMGGVPGSSPPMSWWSGRARPATTRPGSPAGWEPWSRFSTSTSTSFGCSTPSSTARSAPGIRRPTTWRAPSSAPTWSSARCCCPAPRPPT
ncbi:alanine dehydrogenase [Mycobacterium avium subsp. avium 2285 (R)]|nr:alanine dehydrogenase [Mycobacterium avium subsp. avium 2285 (R)]